MLDLSNSETLNQLRLELTQHNFFSIDMLYYIYNTTEYSYAAFFKFVKELRFSSSQL